MGILEGILGQLGAKKKTSEPAEGYTITDTSSYRVVMLDRLRARENDNNHALGSLIPPQEGSKPIPLVDTFAADENSSSNRSASDILRGTLEE